MQKIKIILFLFLILLYPVAANAYIGPGIGAGLIAIIIGFIVTILMMYFNNQILPEMNHKARMLSSDISKKRPDLDFEVGYFIESIPDYTFYY